ncbi:short-subunit dehydrogenase [Litorivivens lipolytica]|uniref:Short-subunit dehydrogenase n=1 Tax=Litorivivens lipolytica TaxID=1524264 RepID=A0A7W4W2R1_9GAMM|nr:SDR family NAD(P)-dependent oxidoreductase [Litorivivens lipolytica]MBB3045837.1 short-subunit dehydrogenase [Litorivivens lipolytica]
MKSLKEKVAVITGAGSGIGRALALELAGRGAKLALSDVDEVGLATTQAEIHQESVDCEVRCYALDVSCRASVFAHAADIRRDFGGVHLLINNAGVALYASVNNMTMDEFDWVMGINLYGVVHGTKAFLPIMLEQGEGHIVNISSILGLFATPASSAYSTAKFAVRGFTETLARELEGSGVYASCVHPGGIKTNIGAAGRLGVNAGAYEKACIDNASRYLKTEPRDLAAAIIKGVERRKRRILAGDSAKLADVIARLLPANYGKVFHAVRGL